MSVEDLSLPVPNSDLAVDSAKLKHVSSVRGATNHSKNSGRGEILLADEETEEGRRLSQVCNELPRPKTKHDFRQVPRPKVFIDSKIESSMVSTVTSAMIKRVLDLSKVSKATAVIPKKPVPKPVASKRPAKKTVEKPKPVISDSRVSMNVI